MLRPLVQCSGPVANMKLNLAANAQQPYGARHKLRHILSNLLVPKRPLFSCVPKDSEGGEAVWSLVVTQVNRGQGVNKSGFGAKTQLSAEKSFCERHDTGNKVLPRPYSFFNNPQKG